VIGLPLEVTMSETKQHKCDEDCDHSPKFTPHPPLDAGEKAEPKHVESGLTPLVPTGT
jgi:hypothetical protein